MLTKKVSIKEVSGGAGRGAGEAQCTEPNVCTKTEGHTEQTKSIIKTVLKTPKTQTNKQKTMTVSGWCGSLLKESS